MASANYQLPIADCGLRKTPPFHSRLRLQFFILHFSFFIFLVALATAAQADVFDLANPDSASSTLVGAQEDADLGYSVAAGDLDGDGAPDLIVGAPGFGEAPLFFRRGAVYLILSRQGVLGVDLDLANDDADAVVLGEAEQYAGVSVAAGDLNSDGVADLVVGAPRAEGPDGESLLGAVFVFYGRETWPATLPVADADVTVWGAKADGQFGARVALGDFDGDGQADLFASAPTHQDVGHPAAGKAFGLRGGALPAVIDLRTDKADVEVSGAITSQRLGVGLALGDINLDGCDDLILGAPGVSLPLPGGKEGNDGTAYAVFGRALPAPLSIDLAASTPDVRFEWSSQSDNLGLAAACGDFNGDGATDLALSAPNVPAKNDAGQVFVLYGRAEWPVVINLSTADVTITGATTGERFGFALALGDMNGDCADDLAVGAPRLLSAGRAVVYVVAGSRDYPQEYYVDLASDEPLHEVLAAAEGDQLGFAVAFADFDGNGAADLALGARAVDAADPARDEAGAAYLVLSPDENEPPTADAGPDREAETGDAVAFDGTQSSDPEGAPLTYRWEQTAGPVDLELYNAHTATPYVMPTEAGEYQLTLTVFDCVSAGAPDEVALTVSAAPPDDDADDDATDDDSGDDDDDHGGSDGGSIDSDENDTGVYGGGGCSG